MIEPVVGGPPEAVALIILCLESDLCGFFGPWLMALVAGTFMLGILSCQATTYFSTYGFESIGLVTLVVSCIALSIAQWIVLMLGAWDWFVAHRYTSFIWQPGTIEVLTRLTVFVAQIFFAHRCYALNNRNRAVLGGILTGMFASLFLFLFSGFAVLLAAVRDNPFMIAALCINLVTDIAITGLTLWKLLPRSGQTFIPNTAHALRRLRNGIIEAAAPPAICTLLNLILCFTPGPTAYTFLWFDYMTPRFYIWSLMFALNSRVAIREKLNSPNQGGEKAEALSTGFEFAKSSKPTRKLERGQNPEHTTLILSDLSNSKPPHVSASSTSNVLVQTTETEVPHELLHPHDGGGGSNLEAGTNSPNIYSDQSKQRPTPLPEGGIRENPSTRAEQV